MEVSRTPIEDVLILTGDPHQDSRGLFMRLWCNREAEVQGLAKQIVQTSISVTKCKGTLRGMHFQLPPSREDKIVRCLRGRIYDVALDLRAGSKTCLQHVGSELSESNLNAMYIPAGCAHGFITLEKDCTVLYMMTDYYDPELSSGVRWDDPAFAISWPEAPSELLERDANYPDFDPRSVDGFSDY